MTQKERKNLFDYIYNKYSKEMWIHEGNCGADKRPYSYIINKEIVLPKNSFRNPSEWIVFALLHEIGHIKTNTTKMKLYEKEFYATQWAATEARNLKFNIRTEWKKVYQDYILDKRQSCVNKKGKNVINKELLLIKW